MKQLSNYFHLWRFVRVLWRELNVQYENTTFVDRVGRTLNGCDPLVQIVIFEFGTEIYPELIKIQISIHF